jgi:hypothetical protein
VVQASLTTDDAPLTNNLISGATLLVYGGAVMLAGSRLARQ